MGFCLLFCCSSCWLLEGISPSRSCSFHLSVFCALVCKSVLISFVVLFFLLLSLMMSFPFLGGSNFFCK